MELLVSIIGSIPSQWGNFRTLTMGQHYSITSFSNFRNEYSVQVKPKGKEYNVIVGFRKVPEIRSILESTSIVMTKKEWLKLPPKIFEDVIVKYFQLR